METIKTIPGRGLVTPLATKMRLDYLSDLGIKTDKLEKTYIHVDEIQNNIESFIGSIEVPLGIVGPLLYNHASGTELTYCAIGTLEGALVSSMNRGAKVISQSGGFVAEVHWQKMTRAPMFHFADEMQARDFEAFAKAQFDEIKKVAERYSNYAQLEKIESIRQDRVVHLVFFFHTGDASGQNMTTTCTWHAMLHLVAQFEEATGICPLDYIIEGNGSSDKKVSRYNIEMGRGISVTAECYLHEKVINQVLRTTSEKIARCFPPCQHNAQRQGMVGYNINVANAIASIFVATGQDLACIHESSTAFLNVEKEEQGLRLRLHLPNLVVGTVGGGTHLPKQAQSLEIMGCKGAGKVERFAKLIAGFALGLEISTLSAIVSGEFAKAHEKLGRNKPIRCLLRAELTSPFLSASLLSNSPLKDAKTLEPCEEVLLENGIITSLTARVSKKLLGFVPLRAMCGGKTVKVLLKSKATDEEVIKGLHVMAASIDPSLSDLIKAHKEHTEYKNSHIKEIRLFAFLEKKGYAYMPKFHGSMEVPAREIYFLIQEFMDEKSMRLMNSENSTELWTSKDIEAVVAAAVQFHTYFQQHIDEAPAALGVQSFKPWQAAPLYDKLMQLLINESQGAYKGDLLWLSAHVGELQTLHDNLDLPKTVIHNDFNPRNIALRADGSPVIYDWELAMIDLPHRDIVEFLSFVLPEDVQESQLMHYLGYHYELCKSIDTTLVWDEWLKGYKYALLEALICRLSFYEVAGILVKYEFSSRVFRTALHMLKLLY